jgi:hypothetical protein
MRIQVARLTCQDQPATNIGGAYICAACSIQSEHDTREEPKNEKNRPRESLYKFCILYLIDYSYLESP